MTTAKQVIQREYGKSKNFMTPNILEYGWIVQGQIAFEISQGTSLNHHTTIYGLSVVRDNHDMTTSREYEKSGVFSSLDECHDHIEALREKLKRNQIKKGCSK